jgi:glutamate synthase (ferredoxin)
MTGGVVVVLGATGRNVGAGMTGGVAFLLEDQERLQELVNPDSVTLCPLSTPEQENLLRPLLEAHLAHTGSARAAAILADWETCKGRFTVLVPPSERASVGLLDRAQVAA